MAKKPSYVWGIDIGQCALKALRCTIQDGQVVADAFDYIEYPKILSQPEAEPQLLIKEALEQFLSRNEVTGDRVAISVPGQSGLAKFFKPPPVDVKRIPDIVQYEAKQQIPFPLEDVIWDFQQMAGGAEVDGFAIDTEVGLFAMKREQVHRFLKPFEAAEIELDIVQLAPLAIYNFVSYDVLTDGPDPDEFDPDDPPESIVVLSMGTDATDLVITNGFRVWQRSIPLGGNHFTKQLTKELKLTFAKAEHLKRNARQADDPKTVFQAMRPIFNDMVTEVQRSIGFFQGIDRTAKIRGVVLLGNTVKLPGLQQYISKNLGYDVVDFESFHKLGGPSVTSSPAFNDNVLSFGVSYGLCLQALKQARLRTSLLPREILTRRLIRSKKPWAVASVGLLMLACAFNFVFSYSVWSEVRPEYERDGVAWKAAEQAMDQQASTSSEHESTHATKTGQLEFVKKVGEEVVGAGDRRLLWLEVLKAITAALPASDKVPPGVYVSHKEVPLDKRPDLYIEYIESEYFPDLSQWWDNPRVQEKYYNLKEFLAARRPPGQAPPAVIPSVPAAAAPAAEPAATTETDGAPVMATGSLPAAAGAGTTESTTLADSTGQEGPSGPGWVFELKGYHYFNDSRSEGGAYHVRNTLLRNLEEGVVMLPVNNDGSKLVDFTMKEVGIQFPILAIDSGQPRKARVTNPEFEGSSMPGGDFGYGGGGEGAGIPGFGPGGLSGAGGMGTPGGMGVGLPGSMPGTMPGTMPGAGGTGRAGEAEDDGEPREPPYFELLKHEFTVQFVWQERRLTDRLPLREQRLEAIAKAQEAAAEAAAAAQQEAQGDGTTGGVPATNPGS